MRIRDLRIDGFGRFADLELGAFAQPITVFYGPNEAGKSTLLEFVRRVLFGFPDGRSRLNPYPPLAGGRHGGSVTILSDAGEIVTVHRSPGARGGAVRLTAESGELLASFELPRLLGHHSRDVFQSVFTFTLDELHDEALLSDASVNRQIYSAGMGATKLPEALKALNDERSELFLKGGSRHAMYNFAQSLELVDSSLREVADNASDYARLSAQLAEVEAELDERERRRREHQSNLDHQHRLERAWDDWNELISAGRRLGQLPSIEDFPSNGTSRLETLEERVSNAHTERNADWHAVEEAKASTNAPIEHESILKQSAEIRGLDQRRDYFHSAIRGLTKVQMELSSAKTEVTRTLQDLGPDWDQSRLESFQLSLEMRQEVSQHEENLSNVTGELERKKGVLDRAKHALTQAADTEIDARQNLDEAAEPSLSDEQISQRRTLIRRARSRLNQVTFIRERATDLKHLLSSLAISAAPVRQTDRKRIVVVVGAAFAVAFGIAFAVALFVGRPALPIATVVGLVAGLVAYRFAANRSSPGTDAESPVAVPIRELLGRAENEQTELEKKLDEFTELLSIDLIDDDSLIAADDSLDREERRVDLWNRLSRDLDEARRGKTRSTGRVNECREAVEHARNALKAVEDEWREWLVNGGFRETFSTAAVVELRSKVELGHNHLRELRSTERRIDELDNGINEYTATVERLAPAFEVKFGADDPRNATAAADRLVELHGRVEQQVRDREDARSDLKKADRLLQEREQVLRSARRDLEHLLQSGGATDAEDFRNRAETHSQRRDLERKQSEAIGRLQRLSGPGERLQALQSELRDTDIEQITEEIRRAEEQRNAVDKEISELSVDLGATRKDREKLVSEEESSRLRVERHRLLEEMRGHARKWTVLTIAENLLKEAQSKFERERQPDVIRHSAAFFRSITTGRYERVFSPLGKSEIRVTDSVGSSKQPNQLSRGTREQLFLSLRFGLIRELGQRSETLPVIVDEALVNFDPSRGMRAASAFMDLSQTNQVLVFTCHPQIVEWFVVAASESGVQEPQVVEIT